jgi:glycerophosphoryl diester phosphodiesterase
MKIIGHRGARGLAPENTAASIKKALEYNVDEIEIDVRVTKDNIVVLHHDPKYKTEDGKKIPITELTYKQLKKYKPDITTLEEAIRTINKKVPTLIEIKPGVNIDPIVKVVTAFLKKGWKVNNFLIGSQAQVTLRKIHAALPSIQMVVIEHWSGIRAVWRAHQVSTKRLSVNQTWLWRGFLATLEKRGWEVYGYTLNNPRKAEKMSKFGIKGVITDNPERFVTKK